MSSYVRVSIRDNGHIRRFWARVEHRGKRFTLYVPLTRDGDDRSYLDKDGTAVLPKELIANSLIIKEQRARMSKVYGLLEVVR